MRFAEVMNAADPTLSIETRNTKGSNENIPLLEAAQIDIATVAGEPSYEAFMGIGRPRRHPSENPHRDVFQSRHVRGARRQSLQDHSRSGRASRSRSAPRARVCRSCRATSSTALGLKQDEDFKSVYLDHAGDGPAMVLDGRVAALWGAGIGWPGFTAIATSPGGARFIAPDADEIARIRAKHTFLKPLTVAAGSYPNQNAAINSVGSWSFMLVRDSLPDDVAYRLAKTLHGAEAAFCQKLAQACETTAANTVAAAPEPDLIHPGVAKYLREIGVMK